METSQGSLSGYGAADQAWGFRAETALSASILVADVLRDARFTGSSSVNVNTSTGYDPVPAGALDLRIRGLEFSYADGDFALSGVDLHLAAGHTLALVKEFCVGKVAEVRCAVLYEKPRSVVKCEYVWRSTDLWIEFPWSDQPPIVPAHGAARTEA